MVCVLRFRFLSLNPHKFVLDGFEIDVGYDQCWTVLRMRDGHHPAINLGIYQHTHQFSRISKQLILVYHCSSQEKRVKEPLILSGF
jgi:hypothetical protein